MAKRSTKDCAIFAANRFLRTGSVGVAISVVKDIGTIILIGLPAKHVNVEINISA